MSKEIFEKLKQDLTNLDPVMFCEKSLVLEGKPFRLNGNGYKPFADIYRYIGIKSLEPNSKPVVLVKGRQVGASVMATALEMYFMASGLFGTGGRPPIRLVHCFPTLVHVFRFAKTKLNPMISGAIPSKNKAAPGKKQISCIEEKLDKSSPSNDSLQYKQFLNGNFLQVESTGVDADRLRGGTVDAIFYDEIQDIPGLAVGNANKLLTQAQYGPKGTGIQVYFGTPKQKGSFYWNMWQNSTQQYYYLGCESCNDYFLLYTPGSDDWEKIWLYGFIVKCPHCGCEQDKREAAERGKWISHNNDPNARYVGYHINQLYMPIFTKEAILRDKPENNPNVGEITWQNEYLGEFYAGDAAPITPEEIRENCADVGRKFRAQIKTNEGRKVYAGFDWGDKQSLDTTKGQSYSCGVVLMEDQGKLSIEFCTVLKRNDFAEKKGIVEQMLRQYSVNLAVGDIGYANDLSEVLQNQFGDRFLTSRAVSQITGKVKYRDDIFPKEIQFERDYHIAELFDLMKRGMIRFPFGSYEQIEWLISHCCSMEIKTTGNRFNEPVSRYIKGSSPNDGFMALLNAYLAYKFDTSGGFKLNKAGLLHNSGEKNKPLISLGYIPRLK